MMTFPSLYLIADPSFYDRTNSRSEEAAADFFDAIEKAMDGGVRLIQYRDKCGLRSRIYELALRLREMSLHRDIRLIINDEIDLAMAVKADGVHLGRNDFPPWMARKLMGKDAVIGLSTHNLCQAIEAESEEINYIGFGPIFKTETKQSAYRPLGIEAITQIREKVRLPIYAIGGIRSPDIQAILSAGATGVAVASALAGVSRKTIREWLQLSNRSKTNQSGQILHYD